MTGAAWLAVAAMLGAAIAIGSALIAALAWVLDRVDRRRYVRCLHRMRRT